MKGITAFALNNSRTVIMVILLIIVGGSYAFKALPKLEDPFITIRDALVSAQYPGMPVEQVERLIVRPIEEEIRTMGEVVSVSLSVRIRLLLSSIDSSKVVPERGKPTRNVGVYSRA